jgi:hypothetical protein
MTLEKPEFEKTSERYDYDHVQQHRLKKSLPGQSGRYKNIGPERRRRRNQFHRGCLGRKQSVDEVAKEHSIPRFQFEQQFRRGQALKSRRGQEQRLRQTLDHGEMTIIEGEWLRREHLQKPDYVAPDRDGYR